MKIYLFNTETGMYLGEAFADENPLQRGVFVVPPDATAIAPPQAGPGEVPVFISLALCWEICKRPVPAKKSYYDRLTGDSRPEVSL